MAASSAVEIRFGEPENVLEVQVGTVEVDVPRSIGYFGGLAVATGLGLIEPPLALFIAAVPLYKVLTNTALPRAVRVVGEVLEGAAKPSAATPRASSSWRTSAGPTRRSRGCRGPVSGRPAGVKC